MADNKNMELNDEAMAKATGGNDGYTPDPKFNIGDAVAFTYSYNGNDELVEGVVTTRSYDSFFTSWYYDVHRTNSGPSGDTEFPHCSESLLVNGPC